MTQNESGAYGIQWPKWYVYWRGRSWLRWGCCPNCYSSPPHPACQVCFGTYKYGLHIDAVNKTFWLKRWNQMKGKT